MLMGRKQKLKVDSEPPGLGGLGLQSRRLLGGGDYWGDDRRMTNTVLQGSSGS
jgi:hypothetical protein